MQLIWDVRAAQLPMTAAVDRRRKVAAGSSTFPPPDRSGAVPPVGHSQFPRALVSGQPSRSRRWHPGCHRCLLKGCEDWFLPRRPQARYCSPACQKAARSWRCWHSCQRFKATAHGKKLRRDQARRYRIRLRQRSSLTQPTPPDHAVEPTSPVIEPLTSRSELLTSPVIEPLTSPASSPTHTPDPSHCRSTQQPARASAQPKYPKNLAVCLATDLAATSYSSPRRVPPIRNSVPTRAAKRYDEFDNANFDSGNDGGAGFFPVTSIIADRLNILISRRHVLRIAPSENYGFLAPRTEEEAGGPGFPVSRFLARIGAL